ncbi:class I SAM-dependent methyltransferase [Rhodopila sp.]|uniref:class I SAM-dependent methyltransferase n=1 Tax=Rhodopila sp. TaxID=2480087 RepID=UPI003D0EE632
MTLTLVPDTPHSVQDETGRRYPVLDRIPYLRRGREALAADALVRLDAGDTDGALVVLLADQDDWWRGPIADPQALRELVRMRDRLTLRDAMRLLAWGPVSDYFAHRWSDPTFLAGLALVEAHWAAPRHALEIACGIGHHLRALQRRGVTVTGTDVVFGKLWVARHWVVPQARLLCLDAAQRLPLTGPFDLVACHDAFYFLQPKPEIVAGLRALLDPVSGLLAISHVHNSESHNFSAGAAMSAIEIASLLPDALLYDDAELTGAFAESRAPCLARTEALRRAEAFGAVAGPALQRPLPITDLLAVPPVGTTLRRNPLYGADGRLEWPSERYRQEYGALVTYPAASRAPEQAVLNAATMEAARRRELVDLPERW